MALIDKENRHFDLALAAECANSFSACTGLGCTISDINGKVLYAQGNCCNTCKLCQLIDRISNRSAICSDTHIYGVYQAQRFGGKYIYFCPAGLTCFVSPIMDADGMCAQITAGPLLMVDPDEFVQYDLIDTFGLDQSLAPQLMQAVADIPVVSPEKVTHMSNLLFMAVGFLSNVTKSNQMLTNQKSAQLQGHIGEFLQSIKGEEPENTLEGYPFETEQALLSSIIDGDKAASQKLLNDILGYIFFSTSGDLAVIKARVTELLVLLSRAAVEGGADVESIFGLNYKYINQVSSFESADELCVWLSDIMNRFTDHVFRFSDVKHIDVIRKSVNYIRRNYARKITLEEVAAYVYLSPSYFSKVFKDEMELNFNSYLNKVRIEKSKKLLVSEKIKLIDVSGLVGFEDQSYFSKVFKNLTGVTPGRYREARGQIRAVPSNPKNALD